MLSVLLRVKYELPSTHIFIVTDGNLNLNRQYLNSLLIIACKHVITIE